MQLYAEQLTDYLNNLVPERPEELVAMEAFARETEFPIIGPACGQLCYQVARMIGARSVFEMGSGFGYSTAWFARAVAENGGGTVHHVVWDEQLSKQAQGHLSKLGYAEIVEYHVSEAIERLRATQGPFDLIFNDIDKHAYPDSLELIIGKLRSGGVMIVDNLLWQGRIFDEADRDATTEGVRRLTELVFGDSTWIASLVPLRDGLLVASKR